MTATVVIAVAITVGVMLLLRPLWTGWQALHRDNALQPAPVRWRLRALLGRERFDLVHAHYGLAGWVAKLAGAEPMLVKGGGAEIVAIAAEGVEVAVALVQPADELDSELEGGLRCLDEFVFGEADQAVEQVDGRDAGLADADDADLVGFDP